MTLDEAWPSYFLFVPCIYNEEGLLKDNGDISNNMSLLNNMAKNKHPELQSYRCLHYTTLWGCVLLLTLCGDNQQLTKLMRLMWKAPMLVERTHG
jgi:hypothetical protein